MRLIIFFCLLIHATSLSAATVLLDFEDGAPGDLTRIEGPVALGNDFTLDATPLNVIWLGPSFGPPGTSKALGLESSAAITLTIGSGSFGLLSLEAALPGPFATDINLSGLTAAGATITEVISFSETDGLWSVLTSNGNLQGLKSLTIESTAGFIAIDDISLSVVPIPAAIWLFGSCTVLLGWLGRRARPT